MTFTYLSTIYCDVLFPTKQTNGRTSSPQDSLPPRLASSSPARCFVFVSTIACFEKIHFHEFWGNILNLTSDCVCLENFYSLPWMDFRCDVIYVYHFPLWLSARYCRWALLIVCGVTRFLRCATFSRRWQWPEKSDCWHIRRERRVHSHDRNDSDVIQHVWSRERGKQRREADKRPQRVNEIFKELCKKANRKKTRICEDSWSPVISYCSSICSFRHNFIGFMMMMLLTSLPITIFTALKSLSVRRIDVMNELRGIYWPIIIAQHAVVLVQSTLLKSRRYVFAVTSSSVFAMTNKRRTTISVGFASIIIIATRWSLFIRCSFDRRVQARVVVVGETSRLDMRCDQRIGRSTNETSNGNKWNMSISSVRINSKSRHHYRLKSMNFYFDLLSPSDEVIWTFCN